MKRLGAEDMYINQGFTASMVLTKKRGGMFKKVLWIICVFETSAAWPQSDVVEEKTHRGDIGFFAELAIPCQIQGPRRETFGVRLSILDSRASVPQTPLRLDHTHYGLDIGVLWGMRSELVGLGVGGLGYWAQRAKGVTVGLLSGAAVEMDGIQLGLVTGFSLVAYNRSFFTYLRGGQLGVLNVAAASWTQVGVINKTFLYGGVQVGLWNTCKMGVRYDSNYYKPSFQLQIGLFNDTETDYSRQTGGYLQIGILNRTSNGWWLPFSNFGL